MPASVWRGSIVLSLLSIPVQLYAAARSERTYLHQIHKECNSRVRQPLFCPTCNRFVERSEIVKGYEFDEGQYVLMEDKEIKKLAAGSSRTLEILAFTKLSEIDPIFFDSSYFCIADETGKKAYQLLVKALEDTQTVGIGKLLMHQRDYTVFLRPYEHGLLLHTMYFANEIRQLPQFGVFESRRVEAPGSKTNRAAHQIPDRAFQTGQISRRIPSQTAQADRVQAGRQDCRNWQRTPPPRGDRYSECVKKKPRRFLFRLQRKEKESTARPGRPATPCARQVSGPIRDPQKVKYPFILNKYWEFHIQRGMEQQAKAKQSTIYRPIKENGSDCSEPRLERCYPPKSQHLSKGIFANLLRRHNQVFPVIFAGRNCRQLELAVHFAAARE